jgi:hypothetical protein
MPKHIRIILTRDQAAHIAETLDQAIANMTERKTLPRGQSLADAIERIDACRYVSLVIETAPLLDVEIGELHDGNDDQAGGVRDAAS